MTLNLNLRGKLIIVVTLGMLIAFIIFGSFRIYKARQEITAEVKPWIRSASR